MSSVAVGSIAIADTRKRKVHLLVCDARDEVPHPDDVAALQVLSERMIAGRLAAFGQKCVQLTWRQRGTDAAQLLEELDQVERWVDCWPHLRKRIGLLRTVVQQPFPGDGPIRESPSALQLADHILKLQLLPPFERSVARRKFPDDFRNDPHTIAAAEVLSGSAPEIAEMEPHVIQCLIPIGRFVDTSEMSINAYAAPFGSVTYGDGVTVEGGWLDVLDNPHPELLPPNLPQTKTLIEEQPWLYVQPTLTVQQYIPPTEPARRPVGRGAVGPVVLGIIVVALILIANRPPKYTRPQSFVPELQQSGIHAAAGHGEGVSATRRAPENQRRSGEEASAQHLVAEIETLQSSHLASSRPSHVRLSLLFRRLVQIKHIEGAALDGMFGDVEYCQGRAEWHFQQASGTTAAMTLYSVLEIADESAKRMNDTEAFRFLKHVVCDASFIDSGNGGQSQSFIWYR